MARPIKCRRICKEPAYECFSPQGIPGGEPVILSVDEYEAIRLIDYEKLRHEQCAAQMEISRSTVTALYESARWKLADCIVNGRSFLISGGQYRLCLGELTGCCNKNCASQDENETSEIVSKGEKIMRIAVTYENGEIFQHFGHTESFKFYDIENGAVVGEQIVSTNGQGHGALADFLKSAQIDVLICGGIGGGAQAALANAGIKLFGGVSGNADAAVKAQLAGELEYNPNVKCNHHHHEGGHSCGENKHGCGGH